MANPENSNPGSRNAETPAELKKEREIETTDEAIRIVSSLRELKIKESAPKEFKCPVSAEIMGGQIANGIKGFIDAATIASPDRGYLDSLLDNMMSSSLSDQKSSAETLRWLTDEYPLYRDLLGNNEAVSKLLEPLAVPPLFKLSELDSNRTLIVESSALGPLIRLVGEGNPETMANGCTTMYILCRGPITHTYGEKAVSDGALRLPSAAGEMARMGAVACLLKIMRKRGNKDSNVVESCAVILFDICSNDKDELKEVKQEEAANGTISTVAQRGTQRARRKAIEILEMGNNVG
ncbi:hypothetical protein RHGRI_004119 [Rhododendron griersonianum]|uniref:ARM repeat superfamily protein n=1 Tax=Rhododendron griersonianum TaxID=479676 RepID=A0AAV6L8E7_9ERIC|nr:hypothetical protein RHGRI_004119 [Rhododendron griersonianum]